MEIGLANNSGLVHKEAEVFCRYISGKKATDQSITLYSIAITKRPLLFDAKDERILRFILSKPFFIGFVDGAMAFFKKESAVRKRIFIMLAILETLPEYSNAYLSQKHSLWYLFVVAGRGFRAVYRLIIGFFILKLI